MVTRTATRGREKRADISIATVETLFLEGNYRDSLSFANQILQNERRDDDMANGNHSSTSNHTLLRLHTPIMKTTGLSVDSTVKELPLIRAGAVALQSWYELSRASSSLRFEFLQPFLDCFAQHPMSLELMLIFLKLCDGLHKLDLSAVMEVLLFAKNDAPVDTTNAQAELVVWVFTECLVSYSHETVQCCLNCLQSPHAIFSIQKQRRATKPDKDVLQSLLEYCNTRDETYSTSLQDSFVECRAFLQAQLRTLYNGQHPETLIPKRQKLQQTIPTHRLVTTTLRWMRNLRTRLNDPTKRKETIQIVVFVVCLLYSWKRHRHRIQTLSRKALSRIGNPLFDILEAFGVKNN